MSELRRSRVGLLGCFLQDSLVTLCSQH
ncbi:hypothetical protein Gohar_016157 [Gossypium harknessii]|uniref:Uncharacterized protein n=1 Tax=Gossypium harknessii TaxID=34285 RepID=A0A7J9G366_9ROSI|nr:hypothetical protein [Gossypium harknessii]